jgi:next-to-BRCA1 protein 1
MVVLKVTYGNEIRRITVDDSQAFSYKDLRALLKKLHHNTLPAQFEIKYLDDENDKVTISSDRELADALQFVKTAKQPLLRLILLESAKKTAPAATPAPAPTPAAEEGKGKHKEEPQQATGAGAFNPAQLLEVIEAALSSPEVQQTWDTVQDTFTTCVDQAVREGRTAAHYVQQHPQFSRVQSLLTERLPQAIQNDFHTTLPQLINDIQGIFANIYSAVPPAPAAPSSTSSTSQVQHHAICDACENRIVGIRYKCTTCPDYDLCEKCEAKIPSVHDSTHYFLKLRTQLPWGLEHVRLASPPTNTSPLGRASRCPYFQPQQQHQTAQPQQDRSGPQYQGPRPRHHPCRFMLSARFVSDVSVDDGTVLAPNTPFVKVWRLRNDGERAWPEGTTLTHIFGPRLSKVGAVSVPALPAGEEVDVAVEMVAPAEAGHYVSNWRLTGPRGYKFGHRVWADVVVQPSEASETTTTPAPATEETKPEEPQPAASPVIEEPASSSESETIEAEKQQEEAAPETVEEPKVVHIVIEDAAPAPAPAATPAPQAADDEDDGVRILLDQLAQMGFQDRALNKRLLAKNRGNVLATIHKLLDM